MTITTPAAPALATVPDVELVKTGTWKLGSGTTTFTADDLAAALAALECPAVRQPVLKLGHSEPDPEGGLRWDGEPAIGWVQNMALADSGQMIVGDYAGVPGWLADVMATAYPSRSIEAYRNFQCQVGHLHPFVISAVALLGVTPPGVGTIKNLNDVAAMFGVAASETEPAAGDLVTVTIQERPVDPVMITAAVSTEDVRRAYYKSGAAGPTQWICEMQMDPPQLITMDESSGEYYRVPVTIDGDSLTFGDPVQVKMVYQDAPAKTAASADPVHFDREAERALRAGADPQTSPEPIVPASAPEPVTASPASDPEPVTAGAIGTHHTDTDPGSWSAATAKKNLGSDPTKAQLRATFAWVDGSTDGTAKSDYGFPHHYVSAGGDVGAANLTACSAGIAALNGGRGGSNTPAGDVKGVYAHLAAHLKDGGKTPPELKASASGPDHDHGGNVEFTDEQVAKLRGLLGLGEDAELTPDAVLASFETARDSGKLAASGPGTVVLDAAEFARMQDAIKEGQEARQVQLTQERDRVLADAMSAGKFAPARLKDWERMWEANPDHTKTVVAGLTPGVIPTRELGYSGDPDAYSDGQFDGLFPDRALAARDRLTQNRG